MRRRVCAYPVIYACCRIGGLQLSEIKGEDGLR
jgi:hypothetical protein